jgi:tetratricopeptide (TPR) repeat protein
MDRLGDIPKEVYYFDPSDPDADLLALDGCPEQAGQQQSNTITMSSNHAVTSQDQSSWTTQELASNTSFRPFDDHSTMSPNAYATPPSDLITIKEPNKVATAALKSTWQWVVAGGSFLDYTIDVDVHPCERAMNLYRKHFGNTPYDPSEMDELFEQLLEDDRLQEAEEMALLAVELSDCWVGPDHVESWKAKGNLAHVYHEQGRYHIARPLGVDTAEFFKRNGTDFDSNALVFKTNLANTLLVLGEWSEAKRLCYEVIELSRRKFGDDDNITLTAKLHLAKACNELNEWHEARDILEKITRARQQDQGFATVKILQAYIELAKVLQRLGLNTEASNIQCRFEKELGNSGVARSMWTLELVFSVGEQLYDLRHYAGAEQVFRELVQNMATRAKSRNHTKVIFAKIWLANSLYCQSKEKEATTITLECVNILNEVLGPYNRHTLTAMYNLAHIQQSSLTFVDYEAEMTKVRDLCKFHLGENDPDTLDSETICAELLWTKGRWSDALDLLREVRERLKELPESRRLYAEWGLMKSEANFFVARGDFREAAIIQQNRLTLGEKVFGKRHPLAFKGLGSLATSYSTMGRHDEAEQLVCDGILRLSGILSRDHPAVTELKISHAAVLAYRKQWVSAEMLQRQILQEYAIHGEQHPYVIKATRSLAMTCAHLGKFSEAEDLFKRAIEVSKTMFGSTHRQVSKLLTSYASLMRTRGSLREAQDIYEESWNLTRKSFGRLDTGDGPQLALTLEHPETLNALEHFAIVLASTGDLSKSLLFFKKILSLRTQLLGRLHPSIIIAISNLAWALLEIGETHEALDLYRESLEKSCTVLGKLHPISLAGRESMCKVLCKLELFTEARVHYDELLNIAKATKGENSLETAMAIWGIGRFHFDQHEYAQAEEHLQHTLRILESIRILSIDNSRNTVYVMLDLALCYRRIGQFGRAEVQMGAAIEKAQRAFGHNHPEVSLAKAHLAWTYFDAGKYHEAEVLAQILLQGADQDGSFNGKSYLEEVFARSMARQRKFQSAIVFLEDAISKRRNKNPKDPIILELEEVLQRTIAKRDA